MFYKQITDKESLKIRNDIFIKDVVPILAKKGFIKSPFYASCFGRTGNNGIYIYDMCRLRQCNLLEFVTTKISSRDRYIKIYVNTFALHPKIKEKYSLSEIDVTKYNIYPISTNCMQNTIMTIFVIHNPLSFPQPKCFRRSRLPRRAVLQLHLTPPTSSPHGIPSPTPTVTVASTTASSPSSSPSSALTNIPSRASSTR